MNRWFSRRALSQRPVTLTAASATPATITQASIPIAIGRGPIARIDFHLTPEPKATNPAPSINLLSKMMASCRPSLISRTLFNVATAMNPRTKKGINGTLADSTSCLPCEVNQRRWRKDKIKTIGASKHTRASFTTIAYLSASSPQLSSSQHLRLRL